jgi:hypothetical protein
VGFGVEARLRFLVGSLFETSLVPALRAVFDDESLCLLNPNFEPRFNAFLECSSVGSASCLTVAPGSRLSLALLRLSIALKTSVCSLDQSTDEAKDV